jgi:hypothetical protein
MAAYDKMSISSKGKIKDGPAFVGGPVQGGRRKKENVDSRCLITLDVDHANDDFIFMVDLILGGNAHLLYSTHSYREAKPKYRIVVLTSRDMSPDEYAAVSRKLAANIGMHFFDKTTFHVHRLMYLPSCSKDATPLFMEVEGDPLDVDSLLAQYEDWTDIMAWPRHPEDKNSLILSGKKPEDPTLKRGIIGLFCRAFDIETGIDTFLSAQYDTGSMPNRYTYTGGTSGNGLEVFPDQGLAFSHQDSDPVADGRSYNLFDLVRVHNFGHLDDQVKEFTPDAKKPSHLAMEHFAAELPEVKRLKMAEIAETFGPLGDSDEELNPEDDSWTSLLENHHKTGLPLPTANNIEILLCRGPWLNVLAFDSFGNTEVIRKPLPWRERLRANEEYEPWLGEDDDRRDHWFDKVYKIRSAATVKKAFTEVTRRNKFHPILDYLESQKWDGIKRLDRLFIDYLGAANTVYVHEVTRKMFIAAVKRLYEPGCKFDYMLVLVGPQGANKSTIIQMMALSWFSDSLKNFDSKEAGEHLQSAWIFEFAELSGMTKAEVDEIKAFITKRADKYRVAYDRIITDFPRKCVFFGTTNNWNFLKDPTGNRRFWPVTVDPDKRTKSVFIDLAEYEIGQLWAEVLVAYKAGEDVTLSPEVEREANRIQGLHMEDDTRVGLIQEWLETPINEGIPTGNNSAELLDRVCASQIWTECLNNRVGAIRPWEAREICDILRRIPGWREIKGRVRIQKYGQQTAFERCSKQ